MRKAIFLYLGRWCVPAAVLGCLMLLGGCERPFIAPTPPSIRVVEPDLSTVFVTPITSIRVEANSFRVVEQVQINGKPLTFDPTRGTWERELQLQLGLNILVLESADVDGTVGIDTAYAVYMPFQFLIGPSLPEPRGGHTATLLRDGSLLVTGGSSRPGGTAHDDAFLLRSGFGAFERLSDGLREARTGHTATLLPDGRVLIVGGSRTDALNSVADLVESVEVYDPDTRRFATMPFSGQPIRRAFHTDALRSPTVLDLYGGRGDIRYDSEPRLGTRRDLRSFRVQNDSLVALNSLRSAPDLEVAISGHTQTSFRSMAPGEPGRYLVAGTFFGDTGSDDTSFEVDFTRPPQIFLTERLPLPTSRTRHAAVRLLDGYVAFFGGRQATPADALDNLELYVDGAGRFFRFPLPSGAIKRYGHTATKLPSRRILLLGGFSAAGNSLGSAEFFDSSFIQLSQ